ncbi:MAG: hypothetical protein QM813_28135, partial [Verrucomicrobiota bacterium]
TRIRNSTYPPTVSKSVTRLAPHRDSPPRWRKEVASVLTTDQMLAKRIAALGREIEHPPGDMVVSLTHVGSLAISSGNSRIRCGSISWAIQLTARARSRATGFSVRRNCGSCQGSRCLAGGGLHPRHGQRHCGRGAAETLPARTEASARLRVVA